jgi:hypothetical protein
MNYYAVRQYALGSHNCLSVIVAMVCSWGRHMGEFLQYAWAPSTHFMVHLLNHSIHCVNPSIRSCHSMVSCLLDIDTSSLHLLSVTLLPTSTYPKLHNSDCVISMGPTFLEYVLVIIRPVESDVARLLAVTDGWLCMRTECLWYMVDLFKGAF